MANFTEKAIRSAFLELLDQRPLNKITVKDITERCGINRNSFYYHYQDVPTLIQQILEDESKKIIGEYPSIDSIEDCMNAAAGFAAEHRRALLHIYNSVNRDIVEQYLWQVCLHTVNVYVDTVFPPNGIGDEDRDIIIRYHSCEAFGIVLGWLQSGMREDIRPFIHRLCQLRKGFPAELIKRCGSDPDGE